jgi:hypothetical protein
MHSVRVMPRWQSRLLFVATLLAAWVVAAPAWAGELSTVLPTVSSAAAPPMSVRAHEEPALYRGPEALAPQCDIRCATTFAPAPQFQDEEVTLVVYDDPSDDPPGLDSARLSSNDSPPQPATHDDPCTVGPEPVRPAPPSERLVAIEERFERGPRGVRSSLERPPR